MFREAKPANDTEWLALRTTVLTATEVGVILGLNKWKSVKELMEEKANPKPFENAYTWMGQTLEPVVVKCVNKTWDSDYELFEDDGHRHFFLSEEMKLGATPDATDGLTLLECKSTKPPNFLRWAEHPPAYYLMQLYVQLYCVGMRAGVLAIMSTDLSQTSEELDIPLHIFGLHRTNEIDKIMEFEVARYWETCAKGKVYRVNRKQAINVELMLRFNCRKIL